jgi:hypothetical protein
MWSIQVFESSNSSTSWSVLMLKQYTEALHSSSNNFSPKCCANQVVVANSQLWSRFQLIYDTCTSVLHNKVTVQVMEAAIMWVVTSKHWLQLAWAGSCTNYATECVDKHRWVCFLRLLLEPGMILAPTLKNMVSNNQTRALSLTTLFFNSVDCLRHSLIHGYSLIWSTHGSNTQKKSAFQSHPKARHEVSLWHFILKN